MEMQLTVGPGTPFTARRKRSARRGDSTWVVPAGLALLSVVPIVAGSVRVIQVSGDVEGAAANARYFAPLVVHIVSASVYSLLGAAQFSAGLRRRWPAWHRGAGRLLVPVGMAAALSALWLNQVQWLGAGALLYLIRLVLGVAMAVSITLGVTAIRRRDIGAHRAWMTRAFAIGLGAGTQVFTLGFGQAIFGTGQLSTALLMGGAWVLNLAVAETSIWRRTRRGAARLQVRVAAPG